MWISTDSDLIQDLIKDNEREMRRELAREFDDLNLYDVFQDWIVCSWKDLTTTNLIINNCEEQNGFHKKTWPKMSKIKILVYNKAVDQM